MRDEQNKNRQTEEDRFIEAYLNRIDAEAPDLWDRIEAGLDREAKDVEEKQKKTSKVKYVIPVLAIAAVLLTAVIVTPLLSDSKRHSKEINAGRTTDVSMMGWMQLRIQIYPIGRKIMWMKQRIPYRRQYRMKLPTDRHRIQQKIYR